MVEKSNRMGLRIGVTRVHLPDWAAGADGFPSESSLPTWMIGRLDHMSAAVSTSPLATCQAASLDHCFLSGLSALLPSPPVLSLLHITATEIFQKPELVSSAYSLQKLPLSSETLFGLWGFPWPGQLISPPLTPCLAHLTPTTPTHFYLRDLVLSWSFLGHSTLTTLALSKLT